MDWVSLLRAQIAPTLGPGLTERLIHGKRQSTLYQQQVAWKAFQEFLSQVFSEEDPDLAYLSSDMISRAHVLHFCVFLRTVKNFESQTIANYKASGAFYSMCKRCLELIVLLGSSRL